MCGLFGFHKNHDINTINEIRTLNEQLIDRNKDFLIREVEIEHLRSSDSYAEYLQMKSKAKLKNYKNSVQRAYEVS